MIHYESRLRTCPQVASPVAPADSRRLDSHPLGEQLCLLRIALRLTSFTNGLGLLAHILLGLALGLGVEELATLLGRIGQ